MTPPNPAPASRVRSALAPLRREFANNIRVRFGVWCVLAMVLLYWILVRSEDLQAARAEYAGEIARLERAQEARADEDWPLLLEVEQRARAELNANIGAELRLLHAFATHPKKLVVDRLDISQTRARVNILVSAYFVGLAPEAT